jgi:hypothetical protein
MTADKVIIGEVWPRAADAVDGGRLPRRKPLGRIETPLTSQQSLPSQHMMNARDAATKVIAGVEHHAVRGSDLFSPLE